MVSIVSANISNQFNNKIDLSTSSKEVFPPFPKIKQVVENFVGYLDNISLKFNNLTNNLKIIFLLSKIIIIIVII